MVRIRGTLSLLVCAAAFLVCDAYYLQDQVWDSMAIEGTMSHDNPLTIDIGRDGWWGIPKIEFLGTVYDYQPVKMRVKVDPALGTIKIGPSWTNPLYFAQEWVPGRTTTFQGVNFEWGGTGYVYYWKIQVEPNGWRVHFNDLERTFPVPHQNAGAKKNVNRPPRCLNCYRHCCIYATNNEQDSALTQEDYSQVATIDFGRDWAAYFTKNYPCIHPCDVNGVRGFYCCEGNCASDDRPEYLGGACRQNDPDCTSPTCSTKFDDHRVCAMLGWPEEFGGLCESAPFCDFDWCAEMKQSFEGVGSVVFGDEDCDATSDASCELPAGWRDGTLNGKTGCTCVQISDIYGTRYIDHRCQEPTQRRALAKLRHEEASKKRARSSKRHPRSGAKSAGSRALARRSGTVTRPDAVGTIADRHKARHESFAFNFRYLHPQCWELENIMYENQNTQFFEPLFYWCYGAYWCYSEEQVCPGKLPPRHVYDARLNACLGVRGTIWTDLSIKEVLLSNATNNSFFNISNGTIYSVAAVPPEEEEDLGFNFLTRLPLWGTLFGNPGGCNSSFCGFPEGLPDYFAYKYKNFEYLQDWVDGVNYNAYLQQRRRLYNLPRSRFDHMRYCDFFGYLCSVNARCYNRRKWPGYSCRCLDGYDGDGYFCNAVNFNVTAEFSIDTKELDINATLRLLSEEFERRTGRPAEYFDVTPYLDTRAFETITDGKVTIKFVFGFENQTEIDGILSASDTINEVKIANATQDNGGSGSASRLEVVTDEGEEAVAVKTPEVEAPVESPEVASPGGESAAEEDVDTIRVEEPAAGGKADIALLATGGGAAGVVVLLAVGWAVRRRSGGAVEAPVVAVHEMAELHTTVTVENHERGSDSNSSESGTRAAAAGTTSSKVGSFIKEQWRQGKTQEDSFTLAQDRSGIWNH